jgi:hypothetical protein
MIIIQPMVWRRERDIADVEPLSEQDAKVLGELRDVLVRHNAIDRFGISLLHKHFDLSEDERLVESTDLETRTLTLKPTSSKIEDRTITTAWRFTVDSSSATPELRCVTECPWGPDSKHQGIRHTGRRE